MHRVDLQKGYVAAEVASVDLIEKFRPEAKTRTTFEDL